MFLSLYIFSSTLFHINIESRAFRINYICRVPDEARILVLCPKWPDFGPNFGVRPYFYDYSQNILYVGQKKHKNMSIFFVKMFSN